MGQWVTTGIDLSKTATTKTRERRYAVVVDPTSRGVCKLFSHPPPGPRQVAEFEKSSGLSGLVTRWAMRDEWGRIREAAYADTKAEGEARDQALDTLAAQVQAKLGLTDRELVGLAHLVQGKGLELLSRFRG